MLLPEDLAGFPKGSLPTRIDGLAPATPWTDAPRQAAVCMLFGIPEDGSRDARLILIRRSTHVRTHRGQIGFAGGRRDPDDATPVATALRELEEEIGLAPEGVHVFGVLPATVSLDGAPIVPVVAAARVKAQDLVPAPAEVEYVFSEPWRRFATGQGREFRFNIFGMWRTSRVYEEGSHPIWGLTAHILHAAVLSD